MNPFLTDGTVTEQAAGKDFVYILNDPNDIAADEYNYLTEKNDESFVKVMYGNINGQNALYYVSTDHKNVASILQELSFERFTEIVKEFIGILIAAKKDEILKEENIVAALTKIFIDPVTRMIQAVYVPVVNKIPVDERRYEKEVRDIFTNLFKNLPNLQSDKTGRIVELLSDDDKSLEELYDKLSESIHEDEEAKGRVSISEIRDTGHLMMQSKKDTPGHTGYLAARSMPAITLTNLNGRLGEVIVSNDNFVIGRSGDVVDGVVSDQSVSRIHCKISQVGNKIAVIDLGSANGTFVNGARLSGGEARFISDNDTIRIGKCDFIIKFPTDVVLEEAAARAQVKEAVDRVKESGLLKKLRSDSDNDRPRVNRPQPAVNTPDAGTAAPGGMPVPGSNMGGVDPMSYGITAVNKASAEQVADAILASGNPARLLVVYSASGGTGKSTVALAVSRILAESGKKVFYLNTTAYQTFGNLLSYDGYIEDDKIAAVKDYRELRRYIKREVFEFLPEVRRSSISADSGVTNSKYIEIISQTMVSDRYDIVIVDTAPALNSLNRWLIEHSDQILVVTKQDKKTYRATKQFAELASVIAANKCTYICNDRIEYEYDAIADDGAFGGIEIAVSVEHFKNYDGLKVADIATSESMKNIAARVVV